MRLQANFFALAVLSSAWPYLFASAAAVTSTAPAASLATTVTNTTTSSSSTAQTSLNTYDYIVVGSGPGGGPLAARLAQAGFSVLLVDAGDDHGTDPTIELPLFQTFASEYAPITWQYFVNHYADQTVAMNDPKFTWRKPDGTFWVGPNPPAGSEPLGIYYPRASTLGGCSEHNALVALYPAENDWNTIAEITGDNSWLASNMRQYWEKLENNQYLTPGTPEAAGHGFGGWLDTTLTDLELIADDPRWLSLVKGAAVEMGEILSNAAVTTVNAISKLLITDANSVSPTRDTTSGLYQLPLSVTNSTRARSSPRTFMLNTANNRNFKLKIQLSTLVTKVLFENTPSRIPRATGIEYVTGSHLYRASPGSVNATQTGSGTAFARREVIISAGTFNTPQLLKLSGVGPKAELEKFNIPVVLDSPGVGTNMQDRYEVTVTGSLPTNFPSYANCTFLQTADDPCYNQWMTDLADHGIYGTNGVAYGLIYETSVAQNETDIFVGGLPANFHGYFPGYSQAADLHTWSYLVLKAHSRNNAGTVTLTSTNPRDTPNITFNSFAVGGDLDLEAVYEGVQLARAMFNKTMTPDGAFTETFPGPSIQSEDDVKNWIKTNAWGHHASCSVPIGANNDPNAVLDSSFRVKGITGLRVVDASVFPKIPDFYIAGAIYTISEKAAAVIIEQAQ